MYIFIFISKYINTIHILYSFMYSFNRRKPPQYAGIMKTTGKTCIVAN